ncbi:MAG TPA: hypothetical protein DET46_05800 [Comamonadaceae bacterium]|nr:MAG: hypothetical protein A3F76_14005 [Burkholderiales bacterium RIFCSPLOWO2_12_FULL_65_40]HCE28338.1 hypothetical protein [Comamonadaceae bacterium]
MPITSPPSPTPRPTARRARGFGLLQVLLLIAVMAGLASMGYLQWRARTVVDSSRQERQALTQADKAIIAFATVANRLPCPDTNRDGLEDCGAAADQKGWLPSATLRLAGVDPGVDVGQLRYLVQRGAGANSLTLLTDAWRPLGYDDAGQTFFAVRGGAYPTDILTLTDLCQRLETARTTPLGPATAQVNAAPARTVAYALAHPGTSDADGDGDLFDGANSNAAANANQMEDPARRPLLALYNDLVLERTFASLQSDLQCQPLIDSINTVALGHDVADQVADMRADNIESARRAVAFSSLAAIMTALEIVLAVAEGISDAGNAAVDWAACAASLGLAVNFCAAAPQHTAAIALAGGVVYANIAAVALNAVAAGIAGTALTLADDTATAADVCPPMDQTLLNQMLASAQTELTNATNARIAVQAEITNKTIELNAAIAARDTAIATLRNVIRGPGASSQIDGLVDPLLTATGSWGEASYSRDVAQSRVTQATRERDLWSAEVTKYNGMLADLPGTIVRLTNEIAVLDAQIATNPPNKTDLENQRAGKAAELRMAQNPALLTSARDKAVASLATAQGVLDTATATYNAAVLSLSTAQTSYQTAYANLVNGAGRYAIYNAGGSVIGHRCTTGCVSGDVNILGAFQGALDDLVGSAASSTPSVDAKYLKPVKIQKELDALNAKLAAAQTRETNAQNQLNQIQEMVNNPAACNVTGSAVIPMTPDQAEAILIDVDRKGGTR